MGKINSPLPGSLEKECKKAANIMMQFKMPSKDTGPDSMIPPSVIEKAKGIAIMTVFKAGYLFSGRIGFGLVTSRLGKDKWSAPSGIGTAAFGAGFQIGAELTDVVLILNTTAAVDAFTNNANVTLGGNVSVALGPLGRDLEGGLVATGAAIYSYSKTRGLFAGISLEGSVIVTRKDTNYKFYGEKVKTRDILGGGVTAPDACNVLFDALNLRANNSSPPEQTDPSSSEHSSSNPPVTADPSASDPAAATELPAYDPADFIIPEQQRKPSQVKEKAKAKFDFDQQVDGDLAFSVGDVITILERTENIADWWKGELNGKVGVFPGNYVTVIDD